NIKSVRNQDDFKITSGINNLYKDTSLKRTCILGEDDSIIIVDQASSKEPKSFIQNFNLHEDLIIRKINDLKYEISSNQMTYFLQSFIIDHTSLETNITGGLVSRKFSEVVKNKKINIKKTGNSATFVTALYKQTNDYKFNDIAFNNNILSYMDSSINI